MKLQDLDKYHNFYCLSRRVCFVVEKLTRYLKIWENKC